MCQRGTDALQMDHVQSSILPHEVFKGHSNLESFEVILDTGTQRDTLYKTKQVLFSNLRLKRF